MKVGFFQYSPLFGEVARNLNLVAERLASVDCHLMVLPEFAMTGYQFVSQEEVWQLAESVPEGPTTQRLMELADSRKLWIVAGLPERHGDRLFNSAVLVGPGGIVRLYRKTHLFFEETVWFTPGDTGFQVWDIGQAKVGLLICFDWYYPEAARTLALKGAEVLCHPSNLVLPHCPDAMITRCLENRMFAVTANRIGREERGGKPPLRFIGNSEIVSPSGEVLYRASTCEEELIIREIDVQAAKKKTVTPYNDLFKDRRPEWYELMESKV